MGQQPACGDRRDHRELTTMAGDRRSEGADPLMSSMRRGTLVLAAACALSLLSAPSIAGVPVVMGIEGLGAGSSTLSKSKTANHGIQLVQAQQNPGSRAREQALIGRLEEEIRRLNGRIEQLEFQQRNIDGRFDQLIEDLDQRLRSLEQGSGGALAGSVGDERGQAAEALDALTGGPDFASPEQGAPGPGQPPGDGQLGSIPESALTGLQRPNPSDVAAPSENSLTAEQQYENAVQLLQAGDYQGAQGGLEVFLDLNPDHQLASNAAYWLAETHYVRQNYSAAAAAFARNYRAYGKEGAKSIDNLLKLGMSLANLGEQDKACLTYEELTGAFPNRPAHIQQALSRERARAECG